MARKVIYNGGTQGYGSYSDPSVLTVGKEYELVGEKVHSWHTEYSLKGIKGTFNSVWFDEVKTKIADDKVYMAISNEMPQIGKAFNCYKLEEGDSKFVGWTTTTVLESVLLSKNVCKVKTGNSVYYVLVYEEAIENSRMHMAVSRTLPEIGNGFECRKLITAPIKFIDCCTSSVEDITKLGNGIYMVETLNSVYITKVYS